MADHDWLDARRLQIREWFAALSGPPKSDGRALLPERGTTADGHHFVGVYFSPEIPSERASNEEEIEEAVRDLESFIKYQARAPKPTDRLEVTQTQGSFRWVIKTR
jgi:hypothetical protein